MQESSAADGGALSNNEGIHEGDPGIDELIVQEARRTREAFYEETFRAIAVIGNLGQIKQVATLEILRLSIQKKNANRDSG